MAVKLKEDSAAGQAIAAVTEGASATLPLFVDFTTGLVNNVLESVTASTLDQLRGYAELVSNVSGTLADFQKRTLGGTLDESALKYVNDVVIDVFATNPALEVSSPTDTQMIGFDPQKIEELKGSFSGVSATVPGGTEPTIFDTALVQGGSTTAPTYDMKAADLVAFAVAKLDRDTEASYRTLIALVQLGVQRLVMDECTVRTSTTFHVDSRDSLEKSSSQTEQAYSQAAFNWGVSASRSANTSVQGKLFGFLIGRTVSSNISGSAGGSRFSSNLRVKIVNEKQSAVVNTDIDITGFVELKFRSDYFPSIDPSTLPAPV
ncbi:MAG: hypothetical protein ACJ76J_30995 [Thermoanaerobaculia bacterium]